ncbi:hypothetical protein ACOMHN_020334 [Nucella lapillus]
MNFQQNLLWDIRFKSVVECAELCAKRTQCLAFTVTKVTSGSVTCRGHSQEMTSGGDVVDGSKYYRVQKENDSSLPNPEALGSTWLTKECAADSECSQADAECFSGKCLCIPGYYYSVGQDACQLKCSNSNLKNDFLMYPLWYISLNNVAGKVMTLEECRQWCTSYPTCVTIEYNFQTSVCFIADVTAQDHWSDWKEASMNLSSWQRTCA